MYVQDDWAQQVAIMRRAAVEYRRSKIKEEAGGSGEAMQVENGEESK